MTVEITVTEALAEIKTIDKRLNTKQEFVVAHLSRNNQLRDPLQTDYPNGGSSRAIKETYQSIADLEKRKISLRTGISKLNQETEITIEGETRTISEWLIWRRDVVPNQTRFLKTVRDGLNKVIADSKRQQVAVVQPDQTQAAQNDIVLNISERDFLAQNEKLEKTMGALDGQLSLKNATVKFAV